MRITESQLRRTIRKVIKESIPIYDGKKSTPRPYEVQKWALSKGMKCHDSRAWPYPTVCKITHPDNPELFFVVSAHTNMSLGNSFIKLSVYEYTEENPRGNPPEYHIKDEFLHSIQELEVAFDEFGYM